MVSPGSISVEPPSADRRAESSITAVQQASLASLTYDALRIALLRGEFRPLEQLDLGELRARLAVSMTPLKAALSRLASQGLVEIRPRAGTFVKPVSEASLRDVATARTLIESWGMQNVLAFATESLWADLTALLDESDTLIASPPGDFVLVQERFIDLDQAFHRRILAACSNDPLIRFFDSLGAHVMLARAWCLDTPQNLEKRIRTGVREHRAIVRALRLGDSDGAALALSQHIDSSTSRAITVIRQHGGVI